MSAPNSPRRMEDNDPDVILLSHVWFKKKRTGEEFQREAHGVFLTVLLLLFLTQFVLVMTPSMMRENAVSKGEQRCSAGFFYWKCGKEEGTVSKGSCYQFYLSMMACKAFSLLALACMATALILQAIETIRPGALTVRYRYFLTPLTSLSGLLLLLTSLIFATTWSRALCGVALSDGYQLAYGWPITTLNSVLLFYMAYKIWTGNRPW